MHTYRLLCVGRRAKDPLLDAADDYLQRWQRYARVELVRLRESNAPQEAHQILAKVGPDDLLVVLDERGKSFTSEELARQVRRWGEGHQTVVLVIGGADGLDPSVRQRANHVWSLSAGTLPHRLALVVLCEQMYRAHTILRQEKYHRA